METEFVDLLMDNGEITRIECPAKHYDEIMDALTNAMKRGDWWSPAMYDGCRAEYMGIMVNRVAMTKVMGVL